jgi:coenzyme F420-dependent glucose-6-phosphate dehydrogenase
MRYWVELATEQFPPSALVPQAVAAERAGFDGINVSDHFQPWWEPGESAHAWALLGAIGNATGSAALGTGVTAPVFRHNPATVAQFISRRSRRCARAGRSSGSAPASRLTSRRAGWTGPP